MKISLFIVIMFLAGFQASSQSIYYDAIYIKEKCFDPETGKLGNRTELLAVLKKYYPDGTNIDVAELKKNPFFEEYVPDALPAGGGTVKFKDSPLGAVGGLDVTKFANAIAELMIERAKQELTVAFFNRFQKFASENPEFKILFPKTTDNLSNLLTFSYPQMLPALRIGFFDDLKQITYRLDDVLELPRYRTLLANFPEVRVAIKSISLIQNLENGNSSAADVISDFANLPDWTGNGSNGFKNMGSTIRFAAIFSEGLRHKDNTQRIWVNTEEIKTIITDEVLTSFFMALVYQQVLLKDLEYTFTDKETVTTVKLTEILKEQKDHFLLFQNKIEEFINLAEKATSSYNDLKAKLDAKTKVSDEDIYNYINISIEIVDYSFSIVKIFREDLVTDKYMSIVKKSNELYKDIYSKAYTQAVNDAIDILTEVHNLTNDNGKQLAAAVEADKKTGLEKLLAFTEKVKPYALFMANMVEAKNEDDVKAALQNVILPVGSSSIKKYTRSNISVQTYLGAFLSVSNGNNSVGGTWTDKFGVTAPIGISWTPRSLSWGKGGSLSAFAALFDLGAIVDYKLTKEPDPTSPDPNATVINKDYKVELGQIFSPGVFAVYGFGANLPLALGFGAQYGPGLSKIDAGQPVLLNPSWRWSLFLAVDMPFFTLMNKPKKQ